MDLRSKLSLSSTWQASEDLHCALYIKSSSGVLLDQPLASEQERSLLLTQPDDIGGGREPCYLRLGTGGLRGYLPTALQFVSSSRTIEVYSGEEYVSTCRGTFVRDTEGGVKLYTCELELPLEERYYNLNAKLLSLQGRTEVWIDRVELVVTEDHGGLSASASVGSAAPQYDVQQMLGALPTQNLPPFLQTLVSSLQNLQTEKTTVTSSGSQGAVPAELTQMVAALRQLRPPQPVTDTESEEPPGELGVDKRNQLVDDPECTGMPVDVAALEKRLQRYIDEKFEQLQKQINERFEELTKIVLDRRTVHAPLS